MKPIKQMIIITIGGSITSDVMEDYVQLYDECMTNYYSEEADLIEEAIQEANLRTAMWEEYMWYKHEDYMLWLRTNCY